MFLKPTSCWKLDWEELESNTHNFAAVCKLLKERVRLHTTYLLHTMHSTTVTFTIMGYLRVCTSVHYPPTKPTTALTTIAVVVTLLRL